MKPRIAVMTSGIDTKSTLPGGGPLADVDVVILAGGRGTRVASILPDRQKVTAEVGGEPFLEILISQFAAAGARRFILAAGHLSQQVRKIAEAERPDGIQVILSVETTPLGTAGAIRQALPHIQSQTVVATNGDSFVAANLGALMDFKSATGANAVLCLAEVGDGRRYGSVETDTAGAVTAFQEKGTTLGAAMINAGIYLFDKSAIEAFPATTPLSMEMDVLPSLIGKGLYGLVQDAPFIDIGTPETLRGADSFFAGLRAEPAQR